MQEDGYKKRAFPRIASSAFEHPTDRAALATLKKAQGLDWVFRKFNEYGGDRAGRLYCLSDAVRVNERQCASLHRTLRECCDILDMPVPQLYIDQRPVANAFTFCVESPIIVVYSGLLELLDEPEWQVILGHELGHIKCGHVLYRQIADFLASLIVRAGGRLLGIGQGLAIGLFFAFFHWYRQSELSADRASLLVTQDRDLVLSSLMKLAGGSRKMYAQMDREAFLDQGREYEELGRTGLAQLFRAAQTLQMTHPFPAVRALEIDSWSNSEEYAGILRGDYVTVKSAETESESSLREMTSGLQRHCPSCDEIIVHDSFTFCPSCGKDVPR